MSIFDEIKQQESLEAVHEAINKEFDKNKSAIKAIEGTDGYKLIIEFCEAMAETSVNRIKICKAEDFVRLQTEIAVCEQLLDHLKFPEEE